MNNKFQQLLEQLIPFIVLGIGIALAIGLLIMFSYVLVWGVLIGGVIWLVYFIKNYFFPGPSENQKKGRVIEHEKKDQD
ncbi:hypothetical protein [Legionella londiniensis]|uniref:Transmembrane protein n=1 Tax=Legionella londiniensis TaxID=45068 RepID=A0A0W0VSC1_9GAMM|nr:hypothetical protein [Legionella londiniensis]KTD23011.1 hypothetical protein Llon_0245 [Legionella londiniensis]STX94027.1 Uncharacterised protein [Legionella londiniensis]